MRRRNLLSQFIGRAEDLTRSLFSNPFGITEINSQISISRLISYDDYKFLDLEFQKHKFDLVLHRGNLTTWVVEVNYKHGEKITKKLTDIFGPLLKSYGYKFIMIDDWDSETLFSDRKKDKHPSLNDLNDIINALKKAGVELD